VARELRGERPCPKISTSVVSFWRLILEQKQWDQKKKGYELISL
jgi:hypothetical protein